MLGKFLAGLFAAKAADSLERAWQRRSLTLCFSNVDLCRLCMNEYQHFGEKAVDKFVEN